MQITHRGKLGTCLSLCILFLLLFLNPVSATKVYYTIPVETNLSGKSPINYSSSNNRVALHNDDLYLSNIETNETNQYQVVGQVLTSEFINSTLFVISHHNFSIQLYQIDRSIETNQLKLVYTLEDIPLSDIDRVSLFQLGHLHLLVDLSDNTHPFTITIPYNPANLTNLDQQTISNTTLNLHSIDLLRKTPDYPSSTAHMASYSFFMINTKLTPYSSGNEITRYLYYPDGNISRAGSITINSSEIIDLKYVQTDHGVDILVLNQNGLIRLGSNDLQIYFVERKAIELGNYVADQLFVFDIDESNKKFHQSIRISLQLGNQPIWKIFSVQIDIPDISITPLFQINFYPIVPNTIFSQLLFLNRSNPVSDYDQRVTSIVITDTLNYVFFSAIPSQVSTSQPSTDVSLVMYIVAVVGLAGSIIFGFKRIRVVVINNFRLFYKYLRNNIRDRFNRYRGD